MMKNHRLKFIALGLVLGPIIGCGLIANFFISFFNLWQSNIFFEEFHDNICTSFILN